MQNAHISMQIYFTYFSIF